MWGCRRKLGRSRRRRPGRIHSQDKLHEVRLLEKVTGDDIQVRLCLGVLPPLSDELREDGLLVGKHLRRGLRAFIRRMSFVWGRLNEQRVHPSDHGRTKWSWGAR